MAGPKKFVGLDKTVQCQILRPQALGRSSRFPDLLTFFNFCFGEVNLPAVLPIWKSGKKKFCHFNFPQNLGGFWWPTDLIQGSNNRKANGFHHLPVRTVSFEGRDPKKLEVIEESNKKWKLCFRKPLGVKNLTKTASYEVEKILQIS